MNNSTITITSHETHTHILSCTDHTSITIQCEPHARGYILIHHVAGDILCTVRIARDSYCSIIYVGNLTHTSSVTCSLMLDGEGAQGYITGVYTVSNDHILSIKTEQLHRVSSTISALHIRKIVYDTAAAHYKGMIHIAQGAHQAQACQQDKTLLIGALSRAYSVPALEVKTNDVICTHGSAMGRIDTEQLYYMQTRGMTQQISETLLVNGFLSVALDTIEHAQIRSQVMQYLNMGS